MSISPIVHSSSSSSSEQSVQTKEQVLLQFDGGKELIDLKDLQKLTLFAEFKKLEDFDKNELDLSKNSYALFHFVKQLLIDKKELYEAVADLPESVLQNPDFLEELQNTINYYHTDITPEFAAFQADMTKNLYRFMTLKNAKAIVKNYNERIAKDSTQSELKLPLAVERAKEMLIQAKTFKTNKEASRFFKTRALAETDRERTEQCLRTHKASLVKKISSNYEGIIQEQIDQQEKLLRVYENFLVGQEEGVDLNNLTMMTRENLSKHTDSKDPSIQKAALQAKEQQEAYKAEVLDALKKSGADLTATGRDKRLSSIIGPDAYLLDYYGLVVDKDKVGTTHPFVDEFANNVVMKCGYNLKNVSAYELEQEIREDLSRHDITLPDPIITDKTPTKPQSSQAQVTREAILPILEKWNQATDGEQNQVKQRLIDHFKWDKVRATLESIQGFRADIERNRIWIKFWLHAVPFEISLWDLCTEYKWGTHSAIDLRTPETLQKTGDFGVPQLISISGRDRYGFDNVTSHPFWPEKTQNHRDIIHHFLRSWQPTAL